MVRLLFVVLFLVFAGLGKQFQKLVKLWFQKKIGGKNWFRFGEKLHRMEGVVTTTGVFQFQFLYILFFRKNSKPSSLMVLSHDG